MSKKIRLSVGWMLSVVTLFGLFAVASPASANTYATPSCTNNSASATLNGNIIPNGASTTVWFEWGPNGSLSHSTPTQTFSSNSDFSQKITGLSDNTTYSFRAMASNKNGTSTGEVLTFTTSACTTPTTAIVNLDFVVKNSCDSTAIPNASINITQNFGNGTNRTTDGSGFADFGVNSNTNISWSASASGYSSNSGSVNSSNGTTVRTTLTPNGGCNQTPPPPQNVPGKGFLDAASCSTIDGWAFGKNYATVSVELTDGSNTVTTLANKNRQDVGSQYPGAGDNHGFSISTPSQFSNTYSHTISAYLIDTTGGRIQLSGIKTIPACQTPPPPVETCQNPNATNYGGSLPCTFYTPPATCQDNGATNYGGALPCRYPTAQVCQDPTATNYHGTLPCTYPAPKCQDTTATNYGGSLPCKYPTPVCQDPNASNYHGTLPCTYPTQVCQDPTATNYHGTLPCVYGNHPQPTVNLTADDTNIDYGDSTILRWTSTNADYCTASSGTNGWSGSKATSGSQNTGDLTSDRTFNINCYNNYGTASDSVTVHVDDNNDNNGDDPTVDLRVDDSTVDYGDSTVVRWTSHNADYCRASGGTNGWSGSVSLSGSFPTGGLTNDTTYRITCTNDNGSDDDSATVDVTRNNQTCQDTSATNYRGTLPCIYYTAPTCLDTSAINYRGPLPCVYNVVNSQQPTVVIYADQTNLSYNSATTVRWITTNATSCVASGGSIGWAGPKSIGPGSFYTGSLTGTRTYTINCSNGYGSSTDSVTVNVRGQVITTTVNNPAPAPTSLVLITSSVDRNQPIVPTLDNTRPHPGDEINYTVTYQNIGTASINNLTLRIDLPYEVDYLSSNPSNPMISGHTLIFTLGTLKANGQGTVSVRTRVREDIPAGTNLNFPAILSYTDPSGFPQSVTANVSAQVWSAPVDQTVTVTPQVGAFAFGAGFLPTSLFGWLILIILILILVYLARYLFGENNNGPFSKRTTTTTIQH